MMPEKYLSFPILLKIFIAIVSALFSLVLAGYIDKDGDLKLSNKNFYITFLFAICVSLFGGAFFIEYYQLTHYSEVSKGFIHLMFGVFSVTIIGIIYRSIQLSLNEKTLSEIVIEIKQAIASLLK